jgi:hypothetical protein
MGGAIFKAVKLNLLEPVMKHRGGRSAAEWLNRRLTLLKTTLRGT